MKMFDFPSFLQILDFVFCTYKMEYNVGERRALSYGIWVDRTYKSIMTLRNHLQLTRTFNAHHRTSL